MEIHVKVKTNARKNEVIKIDENNFEVYTTITPENGKANKSIIELLSKFLKIGKTKINIIKGSKSKNKIITINND